ncbi:MAG: hypothetical protein ACREYF_11605 [Gammaproteobacteria bacterium]
MSLSAKIAIGATIVFIVSIVLANVLAPPENIFYELPDEEQRQIKFILITLRGLNTYSLPIALAACFFNYMGRRNRKFAQQYAKERAERAAAAELASDEAIALPGTVDPQLQALKQVLADIHASSSSAQTKEEATTIVASIEQTWNGSQRNSEEVNCRVKALIAIADEALEGTSCSALQTVKAML